jgi:CRP-like cAMP-binding protein
MSNWPCLSCAYKDRGLCRALLKTAAVETTDSVASAGQDFQIIQPGENITSRGRKAEYLYILCDGWAYQFNHLPNGRRQIVHLFMPNDLFFPITVFLGTAPASIGALTGVRLSRIRLPAVHGLLAKTPEISMIFAQSCHEHSYQIEALLTAVGQLNSEQRLAFLILQLMKRTSKLGAVNNLNFKAPLRQQHIADLLGLTPVHVNRVLRKFKAEKIADFSNGVITIHDLAEVERLGAIDL